MNGFTLECPKRKVLKYFEKIVKKLELMKWCRRISHERHLLGDVFVFLEIECPHCHGTATVIDEGKKKTCNHPDGTFKRLFILNPDWIEVFNTVLAQEPQIVLVPDEELKKIVQTKQPKFVYDNLPTGIKTLIATGKPIPLSNRTTSHIKHGGSPYGTYGESILRRLFTTLAYKTKLMTANWIVAERLVLPVRVAKVGDKERPATDDDISDITAQLAAVANDPNLTIVTHHAFEYEWYGATGKIHNINQELEYIGKEILDGLMLNQTLLNGEMTAYNSAQIGVETMIRRLEGWRNELAEWIENNVFLPIAKMQGFIDEEASKEMGETVYLHPTIKWDDLRLRDNTQHLQAMIQLHQNQIISTQKLCEEFDIDYDQEVERIREEQLAAMQNGMLMGGGQQGGMGGMGGPGGMPGMGGPGGGPGAGDQMMQGMPGAGGMGGPMPGGDMGGAIPMSPGVHPGGGMGGGMGAAASGGPPGFIGRKGSKSAKKEEQQQPMQTVIQLTRPEQKLYKMLNNLQVPFKLFAQFKQPVPGNQQPFVMDFAYPDLGIDIEADGEKWHSKPEDKQKDNQRDLKLAGLGWTVLRFTEAAIGENTSQIEEILSAEIASAIKRKNKMSKKASGSEDLKYDIVSQGWEERMANDWVETPIIVKAVEREGEIKEG
jgi:very-short-patch-repair endonuclease